MVGYIRRWSICYQIEIGVELFFKESVMPMYIRRLPSVVMTIVDPASIPQNHVLFNPSYAHPIIYLRGTQHTSTAENNYIVLYDTERKVKYQIASPSHLLSPTVNLFQGVEDLRICWFEHNGTKRLWFTGTCTHSSSRMVNELIVGHFDADLTCVEFLVCVDIGSLPVKNVCPFVLNGQLHLLDTYMHDIFRVEMQHDETDNNLIGLKAVKVKKLQNSAGMSMDRYRGSTSPVHLHGNIWGCVVHDIIFNDNTKLVTRLSYIHHWMEFDVETGHITFLSTPFWVAQWGVEYVSGIYYDKGTDQVTLYVGEADRACIMAKTTVHDLRVGK